MIYTKEQNEKVFYRVKRVNYVKNQDTAITISDFDPTTKLTHWIGIYFKDQLLDIKEDDRIRVLNIKGVYISSSRGRKYFNMIADVELLEENDMEGLEENDNSKEQSEDLVSIFMGNLLESVESVENEENEKE